MGSLFSSFPDVSLAEWKEKLMKDLKGKSFEALSITDDNDIMIHPFYNLETQTGNNAVLFPDPDWEICAEIDADDHAEANQKALQALNGGASGLMFNFHTTQLPDWALLLKEISLQHIFTCFQIQTKAQSFPDQLLEYLTTQNLNFNKINCCIDFDPVAHFLKTANKEDLAQADYLAFIKKTNGLFNITVDTAIYQNAGANSITQLGYGLAHLNEYLFWLDENKMLPLVKKIHFKTAAGTYYFEEIAKLRALRILLPALFKAYSVDPEIFISAATSDIYRSPIDTYSNILRDSISGMASVTGGCDALLIHHFDAFNKKGNTSFSERMARNQQLIFKEESYFNKVADSASGSYYIEILTGEMAEKAWDCFREVAGEGGIIAYFEKGILKEKINQQAQQLIETYKAGKRTLIGVNKFRDATEALPDLTGFAKSLKADKGINPLNLPYELLKEN